MNINNLPMNGSATAEFPHVNETELVNEAETHVQTHRFGIPHNHTNVLLLALSSFQKSIYKSNFRYNLAGCSGQVTGRYQLDPIPKMLDELFSRKKENLDQIIMLCTDKTVMDVPITTPEGEKLIISPVKYFQNQVRNYMNPDLTDEERFVVINVSLDSPYNGIQKVINTLRNVKKTHLYLGTHGGLRGLQRILEATVSLLKIEGLNVEEAYAVEFTEGSAANLIISETENMKIFDFVSGVNEFITCGRADILTNYYKNKLSQEDSSKGTSQEKELIHIIQTIANGIQWCCVPEFENGLKLLQNYFLQNNSSTVNANQTSYLDIYINDIKNDYQDLVLRKHTVADEIKWCIRKKFYQQALTLIESKISTLLIEEWKILKIRHNYSSNEISYTLSSSEPEKYTVTPVHKTVSINDIFNGFVYNIGTKKIYKNKKRVFPFLSSASFNHMDDESYNTFFDSIPNINASNKFINDTLQYALANIEVDRLKLKLPQSIIISPKTNNKILLQILILHKTLKDIRNTMNHASSHSKYKLDAVVLALKYYMKWIDELEPASETI